MVIVSAVTNPLDPTRRPVTCQMLSGLPVQHYIDAMLPVVSDDYDIAIGIDGHLVDWAPGMLVDDGRSLSIVVVPQGSGGGGKSIFKMVAMLGLALAAPYGLAAVGIGEMTAAGAFAIGGSTFLGGLAVGGVTLVGSLLLNAVLPVQTARAQNYNSQSATYSWDVAANPVLEGAALPMLFGKHRITPPRIGIYPEGSGTNQTLNILLAIAGHEIDSITGITINETDIANYTECSTEQRLGTNNQQIIQAFDDTRTVVAVDPVALLTTSAATKTTLGNAFTKIAFGLSFPYGLYDAQNQSVKTATVKIEISYSVQGSGVWQTMEYITDAPTYVAIDHWSAGYSLPVSDQNGTITGETWVEVEQGSTNPSDHVEGDVYTGDNWVTTQYSGDDFKPVVYWKWVDDSVKYVAQSGTTLPYIVISAANTNPLRYIFYTPRLNSENVYDLRVKLFEDPYSGNAMVIDDCYWEYYTEVLEDDFIYPNTALLAIRSIASNKLSGSVPRVSCIAERANVWVYDPYSLTYVQKAATNHAWASYEVLHGARRVVDINAAGYNPADSNTWTYVFIQAGEVAHEKIIYDDFAEWADFIDLVQTNPVTQKEKKAYKLNLYIDTTLNVRKALDLIGLGGRGLAVQQGSYWTCVVDKPEDYPVQRFGFNMATILRDSFNEEWTPIDQRANCIEATYYDEEDDWRAKTIELYQVGFDAMTDEVKKTTLDLRGFTTKDQAAYFCQYQLNLNRYITLTASWQADINAIACTRSQIVEVQHDVPQYGYGGRLLAGSTTGTIYLDQSVTMQPGTRYHLIIYHIEDDLREEVEVLYSDGETVVLDEILDMNAEPINDLNAEPILSVSSTTAEESTSGEITTATLTLHTALTRAPSEYSLWFFGAVNQVCKLMRITDISTGGDVKRTIKAIEHVNEVYDDSADIPSPISPSDLPKQMFPPLPDSFTVAMTFKLNTASKLWEPYIRVSLLYTSLNLAIPVDHARGYFHVEDGDTTGDVIITPWDGYVDWNGGIVDIPAGPYLGKTLYMAACLVNVQNMIGQKLAATPLYVTDRVTPDVTYQTEIDTTKGVQGYDYYERSYDLHVTWTPVGWELNESDKYVPIKIWNDGDNWYNWQRYNIVWGYVNSQSDVPALADMQIETCPDIGNIYAADGSEITDTNTLDAICRAAATKMIQHIPYQNNWYVDEYGVTHDRYVAFAMVPVLKDGGLSKIDLTLADFGLDWDYANAKYALSNSGNDVENFALQNTELVCTLQDGLYTINEIIWDYQLQYPDIDGFAVLYRVQPDWWAWALGTPLNGNPAITISTTSIVDFVESIDPTTGGGTNAAQSLLEAYTDWASKGIPYFYFILLDASGHYELVRVDISKVVSDPTHAVTRGVEGTTARAWNGGDVVAYSCSEYTDSIYIVDDPTTRHITLNFPIKSEQAFHLTMVAAKATPGQTPSYKRSPYCWWDTVTVK